MAYENVSTERLQAVGERINAELAARQARALLPVQARSLVEQAQALGVDPQALFEEVSASGFNAEDA